MKETKYGIIVGGGITLTLPRVIDGEECETLEDAFARAASAIIDGETEVEIVQCQYSERHESWVQVGEAITVDASWATHWVHTEEVGSDSE